MSATEPKMAQFLDKLSHREQQIICFQVRTFSDEQRYAHLQPNLLPFIPMTVVRALLTKAKNVRAIAAILGKLPQNREWSSMAINLADKKVYRMFGKHPELGRVINWLPTKPIVTLVRKHNSTATWPCGKWQVSVAPEYQTAVLNWLFDICGA